MGEFSRMLGLGALASLPLWLGAIGVALVARDLSEIASAAIAGAVAVTLIGLVTLALFARRSSRLVKEHDLYVQQSLALVDCMKEINRRVMQIEARKGEQEPVPTALATPALALALATDMPLPVAVNDRVDGQPETQATTMAEYLPPAPCPPALIEVPVNALPSGAPAGLRLMLPDGETTEDGHAALVATALARDDGLPLELLLPGEAHARTNVLRLLNAALPTMPASNAPACNTPARAGILLLAVSERDLKAGGAQQMKMIANLVRAGVRLCLTEVEDLGLPGDRLKASGIARVSLEAEWLTEQLVRSPEQVARWCADLATHGIGIAAWNVPHRRMAMLLAAFDIAYGTGPGSAAAEPAGPVAERPTPTPPRRLPWRAEPRRMAG